jgi:hypothetical protein
VAFRVESKSLFAQEPSMAFDFAGQWPISRITPALANKLQVQSRRKLDLWQGRHEVA